MVDRPKKARGKFQTRCLRQPEKKEVLGKRVIGGRSNNGELKSVLPTKELLG